MYISPSSGESYQDSSSSHWELLMICLASSTNLDTWTLQQLRTLKVGGNAFIAEFFNKHGGGSLLPPANNDARTRYTSRQAGLYKEDLARRVEADAQRCESSREFVLMVDIPMGSISTGWSLLRLMRIHRHWKVKISLRLGIRRNQHRNLLLFRQNLLLPLR